MARYAGDETLPALLGARSAEQPDRVIVRFDDIALTYGQCAARAAQMAAALASLGLAGGDTVATMFDNGPRALDVWFGCARQGVVEVPLNTELKRDLLVDVVTRADCRAVIASQEHLGVLSDPRLPPVYEIEALLADTGAARAVAPPPATLTPLDRSVILFTSGTTGPSKGVMLNHCANFRLAKAVVDHAGMREGEVLYTTFPLFHVAARFVSVVAAMVVDGEAVVHRRFSASRFWNICRDHGVTAIHYLGTVPMMLWNQPPSADDRAHDVRLAYGAGMPADIWEPFEARFGVRAYELYGSTEQGVVAMTTDEARKVGTCGRVVADTELEIHDEHGHRLGPDEPGEIAVRNRHPGIFFDGYYGMPDATVRAWRNLWFHTGDGGFVDGDGYLVFTGRLKDAIRRRGENISAWEVERVADALAGVAESAAVGVPSELGEEEVLLVLAAPGGIDAAKVWEHCREHLPAFAVPRYLHVVDALPKTATGRVEKYRLTALAPVALDREQSS